MQIKNDCKARLIKRYKLNIIPTLVYSKVDCNVEQTTQKKTSRRDLKSLREGKFALWFSLSVPSGALLVLIPIKNNPLCFLQSFILLTMVKKSKFPCILKLAFVFSLK